MFTWYLHCRRIVRIEWGGLQCFVVASILTYAEADRVHSHCFYLNLQLKLRNMVHKNKSHVPSSHSKNHSLALGISFMKRRKSPFTEMVYTVGRLVFSLCIWELGALSNEQLLTNAGKLKGKKYGSTQKELMKKRNANIELTSKANRVCWMTIYVKIELFNFPVNHSGWFILTY